MKDRKSFVNKIILLFVFTSFSLIQSTGNTNSITDANLVLESIPLDLSLNQAYSGKNTNNENFGSIKSKLNAVQNYKVNVTLDSIEVINDHDIGWPVLGSGEIYLEINTSINEIILPADEVWNIESGDPPRTVNENIIYRITSEEIILNVEAKESDLDWDDHVGSAVIPLPFDNYTNTYDLVNQGSNNIDAKITLTVTSVPVAESFTTVLVIDWLEDPWLEYLKKLPIDVSIFDNTNEKAFWNSLNNDPAIEVFHLPPTDSLFKIDTPNLVDYLQELSPDVIVLTNLFIDLYGRWGLDFEERLALYNYINQGHGLIVTGGSLFDMRLKTDIDNEIHFGSYNHIGRLDLIKEPLKVRDSYRSSLASMTGLGLLPIFEEIREYVGNALYPTLPLAAQAVWSAPLNPTGIPFNGEFQSQNSSDPLLNNIGSNFGVDLTGPLKTGQKNTTSLGWQLEYPFLMAEKMINTTENYISEIRDFTQNLYDKAVKQFQDNAEVRVFSVFKSSLVPTDLILSASTINPIIDNITNNMKELLHSLYVMRMDVPSNITIPISFKIGNTWINKTFYIPIPVEIQQIIKPATIVAQSTDGRAAILRYEMENYRSVYFSFEPVLGKSVSLQLMKNAILWSGQGNIPDNTTRFGDMDIPDTLSDNVELNIQTGSQIFYNQTKLQRKGEKKSYQVTINQTVGSIVIYSDGDDLDISVSRQGQSFDNVTYEQGGIKGFVFKGLLSGSYNISMELIDTRGLIGAITIVVYESSIVDPILITLNSPTNGTTWQSGASIDLTITGGNGSLIYHWDNNVNNTVLDSFNPSLPAGEGLHSLFLYVKDLFGNWKTSYLEFHTDDTSPNIILNNPANGTTWQSGTVIDLTVAGGDGFLIYYWDNNINSTVDDSFDPTLPIGDGLHKLFLFAQDSTGNWKKSYLEFQTDDTPPVIVITSPINNAFYDVNSVTLTYSVNEASSISVYVDGAVNSTTMNSGYVISGLPDGIHNVTITGIDNTGNIDIKTILFTTDTVAPLISIINPTNTTYNLNSVTLSYSVIEVSSISIYINGVVNSTTMNNGYVLSDLSNGSYNITIVGIDNAGNIGLTTIIFEIEVVNDTIISQSDSTSVTSSETRSSTSSGKTPGTTTANGYELILVLATLILLSVIPIKRRLK